MNAQLSQSEAQVRSAFFPSALIAARQFLSQQKIILILSMCMALQTTGFVIIMPLFARRFEDFGAGEAALGTSVMSGALAGALAAPWMGALADRFGRRWLVLGSLAVYTLSFAGYLYATSALGLILLRAVAGAFTAGLGPAVIGIVSDLAPRERRGQWIGFVSGGAAVGWIAGPILGGVFYDHWGYNTAVIISVLMGILTFLMALFALPETRKTPHRPVKGIGRNDMNQMIGTSHPVSLKSGWNGLRGGLPRQLSTFIALLTITFGTMFAWSCIEPKFMFYAYDDLGWSSSMLGFAMSTYGIALALVEFAFGQLSDRLGRKPVIVLGVMLFSAQFIGMAFIRNYIWISVSFVVAGLGNALYEPALSASIMDITPAAHQARIQGIRSTASSLGTILGAGLAVLLAPFLNAQATFLVAVGAVLLLTGVALFAKVKP